MKTQHYKTLAALVAISRQGDLEMPDFTTLKAGEVSRSFGKKLCTLPAEMVDAIRVASTSVYESKAALHAAFDMVIEVAETHGLNRSEAGQLIADALGLKTLRSDRVIANAWQYYAREALDSKSELVQDAKLKAMTAEERAKHDEAERAKHAEKVQAKALAEAKKAFVAKAPTAALMVANELAAPKVNPQVIADNLIATLDMATLEAVNDLLSTHIIGKLNESRKA